MREKNHKKGTAFTLVELITAMAVFSLLLVMIMGVVNSVSKVHETARAKADTFQQARNAFETIKRRLSQTTLQTYWDYAYPDDDPSNPPTAFVRQSDLHFVSGQASELLGGSETGGQPATHAVFFQVPAGFVDDEKLRGLEALLNVIGFYLEYSEGEEFTPEFVENARKPVRPRLIEVVQTAESNRIYRSTEDPGHDFGWINELALRAGEGNQTDKHVLATNVVALILRPKLGDLEATGDPTVIAPAFTYDSRAWEREDTELARLSRNQLPPVIEVIVVAIDETSALRIEATGQTLDADGLGVTDLFQSAKNASLEEDLRTLEEKLISLNANYRIFRDNVIITNSRWSSYF